MRAHVFLCSAIVVLVIALIISTIYRADGFVTGSSPYILLTGLGMSDATKNTLEVRSYCQKCCDSGPETCDPNYKCGDC